MEPELKREIRKYEILAPLIVRGKGGTTKDRCLWKLCDRPLIQWGIEALKDSQFVNRIIVVTESENIAKVAEKLRIKVIHRPLDTSLDFPRDYTKGKLRRMKPRSLIHKSEAIYANAQEYALYWLAENEGYIPDLLLILSPDHPLITTKTIDSVIEVFFKDPEAGMGLAIAPADPKYFTINPTTGRLFPVFVDCIQRLDRQEYPPLFQTTGCQIVGLPARAMSAGIKYAHTIVASEETISIHTKEDLFRVEYYIQKHLKGGEKK